LEPLIKETDMNARCTSILLLLGAACTSTAPMARLPQTPLLDTNAPIVRDQPAPNRTAADQSPPIPGVEPEFRQVAEPEPVYRTVTQTVEVPTYTTPPAAQPDYYQVPQYYNYGYGYYEPRARYRYGRHREPWFPINAAVGAGIGAVIGHQRGHRDRGALIGGAWGLLFDIGRWAR
jgi:hypothetical protein